MPGGDCPLLGAPSGGTPCARAGLHTRTRGCACVRPARSEGSGSRGGAGGPERGHYSAANRGPAPAGESGGTPRASWAPAPQLRATSALPRVPASRKAGASGARCSGLGLPRCCRGHLPGSGPAAECGGGERGAGPGMVPTPDSQPRSSPASRGKAPERRRSRGMPGTGPAAGGSRAEKEKERGGGASSSRQREQQIAPSQWQRLDEVAPNSLRPMTRRILQKPISISPGAGAGAGAAAAEPRCVCGILFARLQPAARLSSVSSPLPPRRLSHGEPTLRTLPLVGSE